MSSFMSYDPWSNVTIRNWIPGDEVITILQKSVRRVLEDNALAAEYEMYITSLQFEDKFWHRILSISGEEIGFGKPTAPLLIHTLFKMRQKFPHNDGDRPLFFIHAIRYLCRCQKKRSSDHVKNMVIKIIEHG